MRTGHGNDWVIQIEERHSSKGITDYGHYADVFHLGPGHDSVHMDYKDKAYGGTGTDYYNIDLRKAKGRHEWASC